MELDLDRATDNSHYTADVCIAGAGIAGLTLANALLGSGLRVALLEGGGHSLEQRSQELYRVEKVGQRHRGADGGRFRLFGGSSTQWGGQMLSYPDDVFCPPENAGMEKWPIEKGEVEKFYPQTLRLFGISGEPFEVFSLPQKDDAAGSIGIHPDVRVRYSRWAPFLQRNLASTIGKRCLASKSITVFLHANVTRLERGQRENTVSVVRAVNFAGREFTFSARYVIVSLGTIESARLLLASDIGNEHDQVGRYFYDHLGVHAATLRPPARAAAIRVFSPRLRGGVLYSPKLEATYRWRREHAAQAVMAHFPIIEPDDSAASTVRLLLRALQQKRLPPRLTGRLLALPAGSRDLLKMAYAAKIQRRRVGSEQSSLHLNLDVEQRPLAESRVSLSPDRDRFGVPQARLDWRISEAEKRSVRLFAASAKSALEAASVTGIEIHAPLLAEDGDWLPHLSDTYHMMGGTRMGTDKRKSVVDCSLKVHGMQNLFVAGCSVFPSGGSSNPTFTMIALTLRLAELLRERGCGSMPTPK